MSCPLAATSRPSSPLYCSGDARLPISISMGSLRPSYNERLPEWTNRPSPGVAFSTAPRRPTSLGCNFTAPHRQFLSPYDTPTTSQQTSMNVDSWQNGHYLHTPSVVTPTFIVTPPEAETASTHSYLEVPANQYKCYNDPAPDEVCKCEEEAMHPKKVTTVLHGSGSPEGCKSPSNSVNWKAEVIRRYRERLEQKQVEDKSLNEGKPLSNGLHPPALVDGGSHVETGDVNGLDSNSTCSTLEADSDSISSSPHRVNDCHNPVPADYKCMEDIKCRVETEHPGKKWKSLDYSGKREKLTEEEKNKTIREVDEIVSSLESIPTTFKEIEVDVDRSNKYKVPCGLLTSSMKGQENDYYRSYASVGRWRDDFFSSMLNLDLTKLADNSCSSSCRSSLSLTQDISPRDLIFGCGRVAELARHFTQLGESEKCNVRRSKSEPDISPRTDKRQQDGDYTVVYSVGLKAVGFSVEKNEDSDVSKVEENNQCQDQNNKDLGFDVGKGYGEVQSVDEYRTCSDNNSSSSEDSNSPWVQLRRLLQAESKKNEDGVVNLEDDFEDPLSDIKVNTPPNMWARMKKLVKGGVDDETSGQVSTSWMYRTDVKNKVDKSKPEKRMKKKSLDSSYLSFDVTAQEPVLKSSISETCLASSSSKETQPNFCMRGERSRSEEALLQKKRPKRRVVFSCVQENSDGEKSPSVRRYSVTKPNDADLDTSPTVRRYSVTKPVSEVRPKFPEAYIRTRTCQSVEDLRNKASDNALKQNLARQFVSMPHIMHPLYIGGHTHLIPIRANSDEMICRHLHCGHLNGYYHPCEWFPLVKA